MILLDTDIIIDFLKGHEKAVRFIESHIEDIVITSICRMEVLRGAANKRELESLSKKLYFECLEINQTIIENAEVTLTFFCKQSVKPLFFVLQI